MRRDKVQWKVDFMKKIHVLLHVAHTFRGAFGGVWGSHLVFTRKMQNHLRKSPLLLVFKSNTTSTQSLSKTQHSRPGQQVRRTRLDS